MILDIEWNTALKKSYVFASNTAMIDCIVIEASQWDVFVAPPSIFTRRFFQNSFQGVVSAEFKHCSYLDIEMRR